MGKRDASGVREEDEVFSGVVGVGCDGNGGEVEMVLFEGDWEEEGARFEEGDCGIEVVAEGGQVVVIKFVERTVMVLVVPLVATIVVTGWMVVRTVVVKVAVMVVVEEACSFSEEAFLEDDDDSVHGHGLVMVEVVKKVIGTVVPFIMVVVVRGHMVVKIVTSMVVFESGGSEVDFDEVVEVVEEEVVLDVYLEEEYVDVVLGGIDTDE